LPNDNASFFYRNLLRDNDDTVKQQHDFDQYIVKAGDYKSEFIAGCINYLYQPFSDEDKSKPSNISKRLVKLVDLVQNSTVVEGENKKGTLQSLDDVKNYTLLRFLGLETDRSNQDFMNDFSYAIEILNITDSHRSSLSSEQASNTNLSVEMGGLVGG